MKKEKKSKGLTIILIIVLVISILYSTILTINFNKLNDFYRDCEKTRQFLHSEINDKEQSECVRYEKKEVPTIEYLNNCCAQITTNGIGAVFPLTIYQMNQSYIQNVQIEKNDNDSKKALLPIYNACLDLNESDSNYSEIMIGNKTIDVNKCINTKKNELKDICIERSYE